MSAATPSWYRSFGKRILDLAAVAVSIPFLLPLIGALALAILLAGQRPFYVDERLGRNGKRFKMIKLRTMVSFTEAQFEDYLHRNPAARIEWASKQKLSNDPRVTRIGRVLRATSLDELPQILNILGGSMSLVGPRPMLPHQADVYFGKAYYELRPGLTGKWQVSERNGCEFVGRVQYDEAYNTELSLGTDIGILFKTLAVVVRRTGV